VPQARCKKLRQRLPRSEPPRVPHRRAAGRDMRQETKRLEEARFLLRSETRDGILEELPEGYKDVDKVIEVINCAGLARKVARLRPWE
jgi:tRNA-splicing ligase RtcB